MVLQKRRQRCVLGTASILVFTFTLNISAQPNTVSRSCGTATTVPFAEALSGVIDKVQPEIPPLARTMRIQGTVRIEVCVSETGEVVLTKPVGGSPILLPAAIEAAMKWRFKPRKKDDSPVPFKTVLEILFALGSTPTEIQDEAKINDRYFAAQASCRSSLQAHKSEEAAKLCQASIDLAERLPKERTNERRLAYSFTGLAFFDARRFDAALGFYQRELDLAVSSLKPTDAELACAHHDVALTLHALGNT